MQDPLEGVSGVAIECLSREVLDVAEPGSFLKFTSGMGYSIDRHHVATTLFAHWPGVSSVWYENFRRTFKFAPILGKHVTLDYYFDHTDTPYGTVRFGLDEYRSMYLTRSASSDAPDAISSQIERGKQRTWQRRLLTYFAR